jgi:hypothetical protein
MDFPVGFPYHLQGPVDAAFHDAELEFSKARREAAHRWSDGPAEHSICAFVQKVYWAFAYQACRAWEEGQPAWNGERVRREIKKYLLALTHYVYHEKHPSKGDYVFRSLLTRVTQQVENAKEWDKFQAEMKRVAEAQAMPITGAKKPRHGYRREIQQWMKRAQLNDLDQARRRLGISVSTLKSIMSDKGKARYGADTLERVLKEIGYKNGGEQLGE